MTRPRRGEVYWTALDPTVGSAVRKTRPCIVVSPDEMNERLRTVLVVPLTSKGFRAPFRISVKVDDGFALALVDQMRAVDRARVRDRMFVLDAETLRAVLETLREVFAD